MGKMCVYDENYYSSYDKGQSYDEKVWMSFFGNIADHIVSEIKPKTVLDVGCAMGHLVTALRERGVEAYGIDISEYAISKASEKAKPYCRAVSALDGLPADFPQKFDLITTIEVIEHIREEDCELFIKNLCAHTDRIIFSSSPEDVLDRTHYNVQQIEYWAKRFARNGFLKNQDYSCKYISQQAVCFERSDKTVDCIVEAYERQLRQGIKNAISEKDTFTGKVYFNMGDGESEENSHMYTFERGEFFKLRVSIPQGCRTVRLDPTEGFGCLVRNLSVACNNIQLKVTDCNGLCVNKLMLFKAVDPQIFFSELPQDAGRLDIEAEVLLFDNAAWTELYDVVEEFYITGAREREDLTLRLESCQKLYSEQLQITKELEGRCEAYKQEIEDYSALVESERRIAAETARTLNDVLSGSSWKITRPLRFAKRILKKLFMLPVRVLRLIKKALISLRRHGIRVTLKKIANKLTGRQSVTAVSGPAAVISSAPAEGICVSGATANPVDPIQTVVIQEHIRRLNLVTDTINSDSLLGGVATALIVATEFAAKYDYELRIITRKTEVNPLNYERIIGISGIERAKKVSFYSDYERFTKDVDYKMEITPDDIFLATSWWSAMAIAETTIRRRFFYIIQEVETFFYNYGSERMLCEKVMENPDIDFIINSGYLYNYFKEHNPQLVKNGCYFEPAFPSKLYSKSTAEKKGKYKLFFYARPNNPRNLYEVGVQMLKKAVETGIVNTDEWDIYCVGQKSPVISFSNGAKSINPGQMSWQEYARFLSDVDLGLCLMYTPHPSYPPFDVACSGGVVLSNKMMNKQAFDMCKNVILADTDEEPFMRAFADAVALAKNTEQRRKNYEENTIPRDWHHTLEESVLYMKGKCEDV